jgi:hypothetical protein
MTPVEEKSIPHLSEATKEQTILFNKQKEKEGMKLLNIYLQKCNFFGVRTKQLSHFPVLTSEYTHTHTHTQSITSLKIK